MDNVATISISSHNVQGFANQREFLNSQCSSNPFLIQCIQEHWLPPPYKKKPGTNALRSVHSDFEAYATSAMKKTEEKTIRRGRGFGGTGFLYPKTLSCAIKPLAKYSHERISVLKLKCSNYDLILINVYMPYLNRSELQNAINNYDETIGYLDYIVCDNPDAEFIILGDFNCNAYDSSHPFYATLNDFLISRGLTNAFSLMNSFNVDTAFTRSDKRSKSLIDYVFLSP